LIKIKSFYKNVLRFIIDIIINNTNIHYKKNGDKAIKNIQITLNIGANDLERKIKQAQKFLEKKEQIRITLTLRGRQKAHPERAVEFLNEINEEHFKDYGRCVKPATENSLSLTLMPK